MSAARGTAMDAPRPNRRRIVQWAVALALFAVAVYGTFIYLVGARGG